MKVTKEEIKKLINRVNSRLALILIDNVVKLLCHRHCEEIIDWDGGRSWVDKRKFIYCILSISSIFMTYRENYPINMLDFASNYFYGSKTC